MAGIFGDFASGLRNQLSNPMFLAGAGMMGDGWSGAQQGMKIGGALQEQDATNQRRAVFGKLAQQQTDPRMHALLQSVDPDAGASLLLQRMMKEEDAARAQQRYSEEQKFEREKWETNKRYIEAQTQRQLREPDGNVPSGYRWSADRTRQEFIPGGPADPSVANSGKVVPANIRSDAIKADQAYHSLISGIDRLDRMVSGDKNKNNEGAEGAVVLPGQASDSINQERRNIQLQLKELFNLGVLNGPDLGLMNEMVYDPNVNLINPTTWQVNTAERSRKSLDKLKNMLTDIRNNKVSAVGMPSIATPGSKIDNGPLPQGGGAPPPQAIQELLSDPSPEAMREFEETFGVPAAQFMQGR